MIQHLWMGVDKNKLEYTCKMIKKKSGLARLWVISGMIGYQHSSFCFVANDFAYWYWRDDSRSNAPYGSVCMVKKIGMQYSFLRAEPEKPSCDRHPNIEAQVQEQMKSKC